jgi:hypothetical protein
MQAASTPSIDRCRAQRQRGPSGSVPCIITPLFRLPGMLVHDQARIGMRIQEAMKQSGKPAKFVEETFASCLLRNQQWVSFLPTALSSRQFLLLYHAVPFFGRQGEGVSSKIVSHGVVIH